MGIFDSKESCAPPAALDTLTFLKYYRQNKRLSSVKSKLINISHMKIRAYIIQAREANTVEIHSLDQSILDWSSAVAGKADTCQLSVS